MAASSHKRERQRERERERYYPTRDVKNMYSKGKKPTSEILELW